MASSNRVLLVTGAAGNVGRATVVALATTGTAIAALDRQAAPLDELVRTLPSPGLHTVLAGVDLLDPAACEAAVRDVIASYGRLDGVAHTVGGYAEVALVDADVAAWVSMFRLNVLSAVNVFRPAIAAMRSLENGGALVAVAAASALAAPARQAPYAASKAAVLRLVEGFAAELRPEKIRVNSVMPATLDTPQNRAAMPGADPAQWVRPADVASAIAFLLSPAAAGITGSHLPIPGRG